MTEQHRKQVEENKALTAKHDKKAAELNEFVQSQTKATK